MPIHDLQIRGTMRGALGGQVSDADINANFNAYRAREVQAQGDLNIAEQLKKEYSAFYLQRITTNTIFGSAPVITGQKLNEICQTHLPEDFTITPAMFADFLAEADMKDTLTAGKPNLTPEQLEQMLGYGKKEEQPVVKTTPKANVENLYAGKPPDANAMAPMTYGSGSMPSPIPHVVDDNRANEAQAAPVKVERKYSGNNEKLNALMKNMGSKDRALFKQVLPIGGPFQLYTGIDAKTNSFIKEPIVPIQFSGVGGHNYTFVPDVTNDGLLTFRDENGGLHTVSNPEEMKQLANGND